MGIEEAQRSQNSQRIRRLTMRQELEELQVLSMVLLNLEGLKPGLQIEQESVRTLETEIRTKMRTAINNL